MHPQLGLAQHHVVVLKLIDIDKDLTHQLAMATILRCCGLFTAAQMQALHLDVQGQQRGLVILATTSQGILPGRQIELFELAGELDHLRARQLGRGGTTYGQGHGCRLPGLVLSPTCGKALTDMQGVGRFRIGAQLYIQLYRQIVLRRFRQRVGECGGDPLTGGAEIESGWLLALMRDAQMALPAALAIQVLEPGVAQVLMQQFRFQLTVGDQEGLLAVTLTMHHIDLQRLLMP